MSIIACSVTRQNGIQPPATAHKHHTIIGGGGKGFLLTGYPIWREWGLPALSHSHVQNTEISSLPKRLKYKSMPKPTIHSYLPFWGPRLLQKWVSSSRLSFSGVCTYKAGVSTTSQQLLPSPRPGCTARSTAASCAKGVLSASWCPGCL